MSRVLRLPWVVALGLSVTVGLGVFTLLGEFVTVTARRAGPAYFALLFLSIPFIITFLERAVSVPGAGGAYQLAKTNRFLWHRFFSGWLLLGGYAVVIALLSWGIGYYAEAFYVAVFGSLPFEQKWLAVGGIIIVAIFTLLMKRANWQRRFVFIAAAVGVLAVIGVLSLVTPTSGTQTLRNLPSSMMLLEVVTLMTSALWGLYLVLGTREQIQQPTKNMGWALGLPVVGLTIVGALTSLAVSLDNGVINHPILPLLDLLASPDYLSGDLIALLYLTSGLGITLLAANRSLSAGAQLLDQMSRDGFFPDMMQYLPDLDNPAAPAIAAGAGAGCLLILFTPFRTLVGLGAISFLWSAAFIHLPDLFFSEPNLPPKRPIKLPFHPLFPGLTVSVGLLMPFNLSMTVWLFAGVWLVVGGFYYFFFARSHGQSSRRQQVVVDEEDVIPYLSAIPTESSAPYANVIVGIPNSQTSVSLLRLGSKLAQAKGGQVVALKVVDLPEYGNQTGWQKVAYLEWTELADELAAYDFGVPIRPTVRLAPTYTDGIMEAIFEEKAGWLVVDWNDDRQLRQKDPGGINRSSLRSKDRDGLRDVADELPILNELVSYANCNVAILRGQLPEQLNKIVVATAGGENALAGTKLAHSILADDGGKLHLINVVDVGISSDGRSEVEAMLDQTLAVSAPPVTASPATEADGSAPPSPAPPSAEVDGSAQAVIAASVAAGIADHCQDADLLVVGASKLEMPERSYFGGTGQELLEFGDYPTILVRKAETVGFPWLHRARGRMADRLPTLTPRRREDVLGQMRSGAVPSVDFFVLIVLSSVIATLGLLQNSGAVIIGAMLVAPLMSPILSIGMGMATGGSDTVRLGFESTLQGMLTAIVVAAVIVIISPLSSPTNEILARTSPNVLDLMVALASGAAAGYAVSRKEVAAALPGVAIAAALVPPLCVVGYGIGLAQLDIAGGALLLFLTNLTAIIFAAALTFLALGFHPPRVERGQLMRSMRTTIASLSVIIAVLLLATWSTVRQENARSNVEETFARLVEGQAAQVAELSVTAERGLHRITALVIAYPGASLSSDDLAALEEELEDAVRSPVAMDVSILSARRDDLVNVEQRVLLTDLFTASMADRGADVYETFTTYRAGRYRIEAKLLVFDGHTLSEDFVNELRTELSDAVGAPVKIDATFLDAINIESSEPMPAPIPSAESTPDPESL